MQQYAGQSNIQPENPIAPTTRIGHVHLKVADIDRALSFYHNVLGFDIVIRMGNSAAFLSAGGYHHHIGMNTWESQGGQPPAQPVSITSPSCTRSGRNWPMRFGGSSRRGSRLAARPTTA